MIAGRANGFSAAKNREATMATVRGYRQWMARYAGIRLLDVWYAQITEADLRCRRARRAGPSGRAGGERRARLETVFSKARGRDGMRAFDPLPGSSTDAG